MSTLTLESNSPVRAEAETFLRDTATAIVGTAPKRSMMGAVFSAGFGRDDWEVGATTWNAKAAAAAVSACYSMPCDPSKAMAVALRVGEHLLPRPTPSTDTAAVALGLASSWMPALASRAGEIAVLSREAGFAEIGRALVDELAMAPEGLASSTVSSALVGIRKLRDEAQTRKVDAAMLPLKDGLISFYGRPHHPAWPGLVTILLALQAFKEEAAKNEDAPIFAVRDLFTRKEAPSRSEIVEAARVLVVELDHRGRAGLIARMAQDIAPCILQATVLSGRDCETFLRDLLAQPDLPSSPFGTVHSAADPFWPLPDEAALGGADDPTWALLKGEEADNGTEWHRVTIEEDAAAEVLYASGRGDLADGIVLEADETTSRTAHIVGRGMAGHLVASAGIAIVERRLVAGRGSFSYDVRVLEFHAVPGEHVPAVEGMVLRSIEEATTTDILQLSELNSGASLDIRYAISPAAAATSPRLGTDLPKLSAEGILIPRNASRIAEEFVDTRQRTVVGLAREGRIARNVRADLPPVPPKPKPGRIDLSRPGRRRHSALLAGATTG